MTKDLLKPDEATYYRQMLQEFNKSKKDLDEYIDILREWSDSQLHFPEKPTYRTLRFLILYNKFSIEKAKQKLDTYYTIRDMMPELYRRHPLSPEMVLQSKITYCVPLPTVTNDFHRIFYMQINPNTNPKDFSHEKFSAHIVNVIELCIEADDCYGFHCIFDNNGVQLGHVPRFSPVIIRKCAVFLEKVYSNRFTSVYLVNFHPYLENVLNTMAKPMLHPKIKERMKIYSGSDILMEVFGKSRMPKDIGGEESSLEELNDLLLKKFEQHKDRFDKLQTLKVNESLRPTKLVDDDILGYYGNFKKINID